MGSGTGHASTNKMKINHKRHQHQPLISNAYVSMHLHTTHPIHMQIWCREEIHTIYYIPSVQIVYIDGNTSAGCHLIVAAHFWCNIILIIIQQSLWVYPSIHSKSLHNLYVPIMVFTSQQLGYVLFIDFQEVLPLWDKKHRSFLLYMVNNSLWFQSPLCFSCTLLGLQTCLF